MLETVVHYLKQNLPQPVLQDISDKMWTIHQYLQSDGRGLVRGNLYGTGLV